MALLYTIQTKFANMPFMYMALFPHVVYGCFNLFNHTVSCNFTYTWRYYHLYCSKAWWIFSNYIIFFKGTLDNILTFSFWLNNIYQVIVDNLFTNTKRKIQIFLQKVKKSKIIIKHVQSGDEANFHSCYCSKTWLF